MISWESPLILTSFVSIWIDLKWTARPSPVAVPTPVEKDEPINPCIAQPCGRFSTCRNVNNSASCACLPGYEGIPPYCRPQCETNADCPNHLACVNERCTSPCINACGQNAKCSVSLHVAMCHCTDGLVGDPFVNCHVPVLYIDSKFSIDEHSFLSKCFNRNEQSVKWSVLLITNENV